jgi:hypothetical protein
MTPEAKVKAKVHAILKAYEAYAVNYIGGAYANTGTPDILACYRGRFLGIEVKAGKNKPTLIQLSNLRRIEKAAGVALVINETNLDDLKECLDDIRNAKSNYRVFESTQGDIE